MADDEKVKSTDKLLQALDALNQLNQARRSNSIPLTRSGSSSKAGSDAGAGDAAVVEEARPRPRVSPRLSPTSPIWSKPNNTVDEDEEEGDDSPLIIIIKPRHRLSLTLPFRARSRLIKKRDNDFEYYDNDDYDEDDAAALLKSLGLALVTPDADGERKGITYRGPIRVASQLRRMSCLFSVEVVAAQRLPPAMNGLRLVVSVRRKETRDGAVRTMPARVRLGAADFDEVLCVQCSLYGATGRPVSFEPRPFVLSLVAIDAPEMDLGRSAVDLGVFAKEFVEKRGKQWDMAFPLAGKAKGGELVVKLAFQSISSPVAELEEQQKELECEPTDESTPVTDVDEEALQTESEQEPTDEPTLEVEVEEGQQKELECDPTDDEPNPVGEMEEEEQYKELEQEPYGEATPLMEVNEEEEQQKEADCQTTNEPTTTAEVKEEEQQKEPECELTDEPTLMAEAAKDEQQIETEHEPANDPTPVTEMKEEEQQKELVRERVDESTPIAEVKEEEQKEPEHEVENTQEHDYSKLSEFDVNDKCDEGQEVKVKLEEVAEAKKKSEKEVMANGLQEKSLEVTRPNDVSKVVANAAEPVNGEPAQAKKVTKKPFQVTEQGKNQGAAKKLAQPRFKWRTVALLVPLAILIP